MKDLFSKQSGHYAKFRPDYPPELYDFILGHVPVRERAWDCGTGNGQAAKALSPFFGSICATDISQNQLDHAVPAENIHYSKQAAEKTDFPDQHFDLITVAQALHWFHFEDFFREVKRVSKPNALFAAWGYGTLFFEEKALNDIMQHFYHQITGPFWDAERRHIDEAYRNIPIPFDPIETPEFSLSFKWQLHEFEGYLNSWSAVQNCIRETGENPVSLLMPELAGLWDESERKAVGFEVFLRLGRL